MFHNYLPALGSDTHSTDHRKALLLRCLGAGGQLIFYALPAKQSPHALEEPNMSAAVKDGTSETDEYATVLVTLNARSKH